VKLFLDANILISVLNKEYPVFSYSSRIISLCDDPKYTVFTSPVCLAIAFYFAEKKSGNILARQKINLLSKKLNFTTVNSKTVEEVMKNKKIHDLEDGLQYYSAIESGCKYIITEDLNDFYFSEIGVLTSRNFLENYIF
jgi:predicted nucleic acid-binding protein